MIDVGDDDTSKFSQVLTDIPLCNYTDEDLYIPVAMRVGMCFAVLEREQQFFQYTLNENIHDFGQ